MQYRAMGPGANNITVNTNYYNRSPHWNNREPCVNTHLGPLMDPFFRNNNFQYQYHNEAHYDSNSYQQPYYSNQCYEPIYYKPYKRHHLDDIYFPNHDEDSESENTSYTYPNQRRFGTNKMYHQRPMTNFVNFHQRRYITRHQYPFPWKKTDQKKSYGSRQASVSSIICKSTNMNKAKLDIDIKEVDKSVVTRPLVENENDIRLPDDDILELEVLDDIEIDESSKIETVKASTKKSSLIVNLDKNIEITSQKYTDNTSKPKKRDTKNTTISETITSFTQPKYDSSLKAENNLEIKSDVKNTGLIKETNNDKITDQKKIGNVQSDLKGSNLVKNKQAKPPDYLKNIEPKIENTTINTDQASTTSYNITTNNNNIFSKDENTQNVDNIYLLNEKTKEQGNNTIENNSNCSFNSNQSNQKNIKVLRKISSSIKLKKNVKDTGSLNETIKPKITDKTENGMIISFASTDQANAENIIKPMLSQCKTLFKPVLCQKSYVSGKQISVDGKKNSETSKINNKLKINGDMPARHSTNQVEKKSPNMYDLNKDCNDFRKKSLGKPNHKLTLDAKKSEILTIRNIPQIIVNDVTSDKKTKSNSGNSHRSMPDIGSCLKVAELDATSMQRGKRKSPSRVPKLSTQNNLIETEIFTIGNLPQIIVNDVMSDKKTKSCCLSDENKNKSNKMSSNIRNEILLTNNLSDSDEDLIKPVVFSKKIDLDEEIERTNLSVENNLHLNIPSKFNFDSDQETIHLSDEFVDSLNNISDEDTNVNKKVSSVNLQDKVTSVSISTKQAKKRRSLENIKSTFSKKSKFNEAKKSKESVVSNRANVIQVTLDDYINTMKKRKIALPPKTLKNKIQALFGPDSENEFDEGCETVKCNSENKNKPLDVKFAKETMEFVPQYITSDLQILKVDTAAVLPQIISDYSKATVADVNILYPETQFQKNKLKVKIEEIDLTKSSNSSDDEINSKKHSQVSNLDETINLQKLYKHVACVIAPFVTMALQTHQLRHNYSSYQSICFNLHMALTLQEWPLIVDFKYIIAEICKLLQNQHPKLTMVHICKILYTLISLTKPETPTNEFTYNLSRYMTLIWSGIKDKFALINQGLSDAQYQQLVYQIEQYKFLVHSWNERQRLQRELELLQQSQIQNHANLLKIPNPNQQGALRNISVIQNQIIRNGVTNQFQPNLGNFYQKEYNNCMSTNNISNKKPQTWVQNKPPANSSLKEILTTKFTNGRTIVNLNTTSSDTEHHVKPPNQIVSQPDCLTTNFQKANYQCSVSPGFKQNNILQIDNQIKINNSANSYLISQHSNSTMNTYSQKNVSMINLAKISCNTSDNSHRSMPDIGSYLKVAQLDATSTQRDKRISPSHVSKLSPQNNLIETGSHLKVGYLDTTSTREQRKSPFSSHVPRFSQNNLSENRCSTNPLINSKIPHEASYMSNVLKKKDIVSLSATAVNTNSFSPQHKNRLNVMSMGASEVNINSPSSTSNAQQSQRESWKLDIFSSNISNETPIHASSLKTSRVIVDKSSLNKNQSQNETDKSELSSISVKDNFKIRLPYSVPFQHLTTDKQTQSPSDDDITDNVPIKEEPSLLSVDLSRFSSDEIIDLTWLDEPETIQSIANQDMNFNFNNVEQQTTQFSVEMLNGNKCICGKIATFLCANCMRVMYCSKVCQKIHWPDHKAFCLNSKLR